MTWQTIENGERGLSVRTKINQMFEELYGNVGKVKYNYNDENEGFLENKLIAGTGIGFSVDAEDVLTIINTDTGSSAIATAWQQGGNALTGTKFLGSTNANLVQIGANNQQMLEFQTTNAVKFLTGQYWYPTADSTTAFQLRRADGNTVTLSCDTINNYIEVSNLRISSLGRITFSNGKYIESESSYAVKVSGWLNVIGGIINSALYTGLISRMDNPISNIGLYIDYSYFNIKLNTTSIMMIKSDGMIGINTSTPATYLDINGNIRATTNMHLTGSGYLYLNEASVSADTVNDVRLYASGGTFYIQKCTGASATKGAGTWVTIFSA